LLQKYAEFRRDPWRSPVQARRSPLIQIDTTEATQRMQTMIETAVGIVMGSQSDWATMKQAAEVLDELDVRYEATIVSAHRTPERLRTYGRTAVERGLKVIIAGAGGAAHLPGMMAAHTRLPVLGVPVQSRALNGLDSLYSIVQMPKGVPVGTMAIGPAGAANAGLMAASILALDRPDLAERLERWRSAQSDSVAEEPVDE
jgi:5-(carboxyamino)imidazole ribonucleotide mutase